MPEKKNIDAMMAKTRPIPIIEEIDFCRPFRLFCGLKKYPYAFFLDSACDHEKLGRYSIMGCDPFLLFKTKRDLISLKWSDGREEEFRSNPFLVLKDVMRRYERPPEPQGLPMSCGGAVGYFSYDLKSFVEELPETCIDDIGIPDCILGFYDTALICDNLNERSYIVSTGLPSGSKRRALERLRELKARLERKSSSQAPFESGRGVNIKSNFSRPAYIKAVRKAKDYIRRGDIYQVNLSQRYEARLRMPALELYRRLRTFSPAPFAAYLDFKEVEILSSSPERFLRTRGSHIETRPIKGTRPRGRNLSGDRAMARQLARSRKDMAEHIMIVDLERNDLGRICRYGSVKPTESSIIEKYANVFHMVSTVSGTLKDGVGTVDRLMAAFPGGSITGAPKIRSMEIIDELERTKRSVYTGAIGYLGFDGNMDTSIAIRTFIVKAGRIYFQVGGGIVADSDPGSEYEETLHKARGLMQALGAVS